MSKRKPDRPWHLIPQELRKSAINNLEFDASDGGCECGGPFGPNPRKCKGDCAARSEMFHAAAQALRELAPYPDEALAYEFSGSHVEFIDNNEGLAEVRDVNGFVVAAYYDELIPLTPAAEEFLDELKAGVR